MTQTAVIVEKLGKRYRIGRRVPYRALRDVLTGALRFPLSFFSARGRSDRAASDVPPRWFWALKDVSLEVGVGEVIGIIGRNGAGKSTFLKILSRITQPTEGSAAIYGRVGSLLEVGTGFHPELTGRENIYLNGAILGMRRFEIDRKFNEIVAFSEIENFIDTPVKYYSSGMYVRLAFSVAAHLNPEILLVDEVLSVGDAAFQKKCLGKMGDVSHSGRTIFFVSHQMDTVRKLCERCLWFDGGEIRMFDSAMKVVNAYEASFRQKEFGRSRSSDGIAAKFLHWGILDPRDEQPNALVTTGPFKIGISLEVKQAIRNAIHGISLYDGEKRLLWEWSTGNQENRIHLEPGNYHFVYKFPGLPLRAGHYSWHVCLYGESSGSEWGLLDEWHCLPELSIAPKLLSENRFLGSGILNFACDLQIETLEVFQREN